MSNLANEYNKYFDSHFKGLAFMPRRDDKICKIEKLVGSNKQVLDVGCMTGYLAHFLQLNGNIVSGVDLLASAINIANQNNINAQVCDIDNQPLPFGDSIFDVVVFSEVIEHLVDPIFVLNQIYRVLKPGGMLIVSTPNIAYVQYRIELLMGKLPDFCEFRNKYSERYYNFQHKTLFTHGALMNTLKEAGFVITSWTSHSAYKNRVEKLFNFLERAFPCLFRKNMIAVAKKI